MKRIVVFIKDTKEKILNKLLFWSMENDYCHKSLAKSIAFSLIKRRRQIIGFYGECHIDVYYNYIKSIRALRKKYICIFGGDINRLAKDICREIGSSDIWNKCDYVIYNPRFSVSNTVPDFSTVKTWLKQECKLISVTNVVFEGYMPQHTSKVFENDKYFVWGDKNLNRIIENWEGDYEPIYAVFKEDYYTKDYVDKHFNKSIERLKKLEEKCTVKIGDYIMEHGRERVLFYSCTHPTEEIMKEITKRILVKLNKDISLSDISLLDKINEGSLFGHAEVVYPSVYKGLGLSGDYRNRRITPGKYSEYNYDFEQYVWAYIEMGLRSSNKR